MGGFPSQEQAVHPVTEADVATTAVHPSQPQRLSSRGRTTRTTHALVNKAARGRLLFLGLDGAGKSTIITHLARICEDDTITTVSQQQQQQQQTTATTPLVDEQIDGLRADECDIPILAATKTVESWSYKLARDTYVQLLDTPGRRAYRRKWYTTSLGSVAATKTQSLRLLGVVFVVDVSDRVRFPVVASELVRFLTLQAHKTALQRTQLLLLLNKTDVVSTAVAATAFDKRTSVLQQPADVDASDTTARRAAMRAARRELQQCIDHALRCDRKRNAHLYSQSTQSTAPAGGHSASQSIHTVNVSVPPSTSINAHDASATHTSTALLAPICECCAHDHASVRAIHAWLQHELQHVR